MRSAATDTIETPHAYKRVLLGQAVELEWLADNCPTAEGQAICWRKARAWRSVALYAGLRDWGVAAKPEDDRVRPPG